MRTRGEEERRIPVESPKSCYVSTWWRVVEVNELLQRGEGRRGGGAGRGGLVGGEVKEEEQKKEDEKEEKAKSPAMCDHQHASILPDITLFLAERPASEAGAADCCCC